MVNRVIRYYKLPRVIVKYLGVSSLLTRGNTWGWFRFRGSIKEAFSLILVGFKRMFKDSRRLVKYNNILLTLLMRLEDKLEGCKGYEDPMPYYIS